MWVFTVLFLRFYGQVILTRFVILAGVVLLSTSYINRAQN